MTELNLKNIKRPEAFLGKISERVRKEAVKIVSSCKGKLLLDVGCGNGLFLLSLKIYSKWDERKLFGVDKNLELLVEARTLAADNRVKSGNLINADAAILPFRNNHFDISLCLNTFINLERDIVHKIIMELSRVTKPGGYIIFDIRNKNNPLLTLKYLISRLKTPLKIRAYRISELQESIKKANLEIEKKVKIGQLLFLTVDTLLVLKKKGG